MSIARGMLGVSAGAALPPPPAAGAARRSGARSVRPCAARLPGLLPQQRLGARAVTIGSRPRAPGLLPGTHTGTPLPQQPQRRQGQRQRQQPAVCQAAWSAPLPGRESRMSDLSYLPPMARKVGAQLGWWWWWGFWGGLAGCVAVACPPWLLPSGASLPNGPSGLDNWPAAVLRKSSMHVLHTLCTVPVRGPPLWLQAYRTARRVVATVRSWSDNPTVRMVSQLLQVRLSSFPAQRAKRLYSFLFSSAMHCVRTARHCCRWDAALQRRASAGTLQQAWLLFVLASLLASLAALYVDQPPSFVSEP